MYSTSKDFNGICYHLNSLLLCLTLDPVEVELKMLNLTKASLRRHQLVIPILSHCYIVTSPSFVIVKITITNW